MLSINSNVGSLFGARDLNRVTAELNSLSNQILTGKRVITARDDPAGVGVLSTLKAQTSSYGAVIKNLSAGMSLLDTASTSLEIQQDILKEMKSLATQAASDLLSADQRAALQNTFVQLQAQLDEAVNRANLFGQNLTGATSADVTLQSGINAGQTTTLTAVRSDGATLGIDAGTIDLNNSANAAAAMNAIDTAVGTIASNQAIIGAQQNGLKLALENAKSIKLNIESSISKIEDLDIAEATARLNMLQVKQQLGISLLGLINGLPQAALGLLRG